MSDLIARPSKAMNPTIWGKVHSLIRRDAEPGCWQWTGTYVSHGYGRICVRGKRWPAHRLVYALYVAVVPDDLTLDHLCRNRGCVNPGHLEVVTRGENTLRGETITAHNKAKTHCPQGHPYDDVNTWVDRRGKRYCRACSRDRQRRLRAATKEMV